MTLRPYSFTPPLSNPAQNLCVVVTGLNHIIMFVYDCMNLKEVLAIFVRG